MLRENDGHLFGMIILHTNYHTGGLNQPELVDGQQRMTTLVILLKALQNAYRNNDKVAKADKIEKMLKCKGGLTNREKQNLKLKTLRIKTLKNFCFTMRLMTYRTRIFRMPTMTTEVGLTWRNGTSTRAH